MVRLSCPFWWLLNGNLGFSCWPREVGSILPTLLYTRQCTLVRQSMTLEIRDANQTRYSIRSLTSSGTVFDRRNRRREKFPREQYWNTASLRPSPRGPSRAFYMHAAFSVVAGMIEVEPLIEWLPRLSPQSIGSAPSDHYLDGRVARPLNGRPHEPFTDRR